MFFGVLAWPKTNYTTMCCVIIVRDIVNQFEWLQLYSTCFKLLKPHEGSNFFNCFSNISQNASWWHLQHRFLKPNNLKIVEYLCAYEHPMKAYEGKTMDLSQGLDCSFG